MRQLLPPSHRHVSCRAGDNTFLLYFVSILIHYILFVKLRTLLSHERLVSCELSPQEAISCNSESSGRLHLILFRICSAGILFGMVVTLMCMIFQPRVAKTEMYIGKLARSGQCNGKYVNILSRLSSGLRAWEKEPSLVT